MPLYHWLEFQHMNLGVGHKHSVHLNTHSLSVYQSKVSGEYLVDKPTETSWVSIIVSYKKYFLPWQFMWAEI